MLFCPSAEADGNKKAVADNILPFGFSQRVGEELMLMGFSHILNMDDCAKAQEEIWLFCPSAEADGNGLVTATAKVGGNKSS